MGFKITGKTYSTGEEEIDRMKIFLDNVKLIEQHNWEYFNMKKSYYMDINQFTDMTFEEYKKYNRLQARDSSRNATIQCTQFQPPLNWLTPAEVDWRKEGYVTPVKNQGQCGSCWSFSTTGSMEGQHFRLSKKLDSLSEQQLVDCSGKFGNQGCDGGLMDQAFEYINSVGGLESESDYPYEAVQHKCSFKKKEIVTETYVKGCQDIQSGSESDLMQAVASQGPISVAIDAGHPSFQSYSGGVYDEPGCSSSELDHGVLVVGYGSSSGQEYWLVKNSWGTSWGDEGYIMMARNKDNQCGIATAASFPQLSSS
ncbi:hypothetical protein C0Q70_10879 [Pomacea canaliculata]|uniref:Peptidase C1A papain C-terminal domain-containing protein n=1 Tax=Pomacea canaliculata TaxID=400727 RepID=A0A2T7P4E7_POMCA|nr:hypothetical protein C0Q70_10879 [Pomacea canaliculata]